MMKTRVALSAVALLAIAGQAMGQVTIDGKADGADFYGSLLWSQNQPTSFGDNIAGLGAAPGDPATVNKGFEIAIPMSVLGNPNPVNGIKFMGLVTSGGGYISNQIIGQDGLAPTQNNVAGPRGINFETQFAGLQHMNIVPQFDNNPPTMDGSLDTDGYWNGRRVWIQSTCTGFGDNTNAAGPSATGSELDNCYAVIWRGADLNDPIDDVLYLFIGGNVESNGNKLALFFDTQAGGQNQMLFGNVDYGFGFMTNSSESASGANDGLTFDAGFEPEQVIYWNTGGGTLYADVVTMPTVPPGVGNYVGSTPFGAQPGAMNGGNIPPVVMRYNNGNTAGVGGCGGSPTVTPDVDLALGSEINGLYGKIEGNKLFLVVTGNLEINYNKLELFLDVDPAEGQNQLRADNVEVNFRALLRMGPGGDGAPTGGAGLKFDDGFTADYYLTVGNGGLPVNNYVDAAVLRANGPVFNSGFLLDYNNVYAGGAKATNNPMNYLATYADVQDFTITEMNTDCAPRTAQLNPDAVNTNPGLYAGLIKVSIDNSNVLGVTGLTGTPSVADAPNVITGVEFELDLTELGWDGSSPVRVAGFLNNDNHSFMSNQVIGGLPSSAELGETSAVDFSVIDGLQYIEIPAGGCVVTCDFNQDGGGDTSDVIDLADAIASGSDPYPGSCIDFNQDGGGDTSDVIDLADAVASGTCP